MLRGNSKHHRSQHMIHNSTKDGWGEEMLGCWNQERQPPSLQTCHFTVLYPLPILLLPHPNVLSNGRHIHPFPRCCQMTVAQGLSILRSLWIEAAQIYVQWMERNSLCLWIHSSMHPNNGFWRELVIEGTYLVPSGWQAENLMVFYFTVYVFCCHLYVINNTDFSIRVREIFTFV